MIPSGLTGEQFRFWRKKMMWSQELAAQKLGISLSSVQSYERGRRADKINPIPIPLLAAWAMSAIMEGLSPFGRKKEDV